MNKPKPKKFKNKPGRRPRLVLENGDHIIISGTAYSADAAERVAVEIMRAAARTRARQDLTNEIRRRLGVM